MKTKWRKWICFIAFSILTIIIALLDLILTCIGTNPDLSNEANPIISMFGGGLTHLIIINIIVIPVFIALYYFSLVKYQPEFVECDNFRQYISMLFYGRPDKFIWSLYKWPKTKEGKRFVLALSGIIAISGNVARLRCVLEWILAITDRKLFVSYFSTFKGLSFKSVFGRFDMIIFFLIIISITCILWIYLQYRKNQKVLKMNKVLSKLNEE